MPWKNSGRILVGEDDPDLLEGTAGILTRAGFLADRARNGAEVLAGLRDQPDVLLLDRDLPDMDGVEIVRRIRQNPSPSDPLVVLISGSANNSADMAQGLEMGADGYIARPISDRELVARVGAFARIAYLNRSSREMARRLTEQNEMLGQQRARALRLSEEALAAKDRATMAQGALRESEAQFRSFVEGAADAIFVQVDNRFAYMNGAACRLFGADEPDQLLNQPIMDRIPLHQRELVKARIRRTNELHEATPVIDQIYLRLDGTELPVEVSAVPLTFRGQQGALVFAHDITRRRARERQQALALHVLGALNRDDADTRLTEELETVPNNTDEVGPRAPRASPLSEPGAWQGQPGYCHTGRS